MGRKRQWSPQRRVHPPPWGAGGLLTWTGLLSGRTEKELGGLCSHVDKGAPSHCVFAQHVWASLQKMDAGTEAGVGVWTESLKAGGLSALLLLWYGLQTESSHIEQRTCEPWFDLFFIHLQAVDRLKNHTGGFICFSPLTTQLLYRRCHPFSKHTSVMPAQPTATFYWKRKLNSHSLFFGHFLAAFCLTCENDFPKA